MATKRISRTTIAALLVAAATAAPAAGMPLDPVRTSGSPPPSSIEQPAAPEYNRMRTVDDVQLAPAPEAVVPAARAMVTDGGFDFPSAAIGAAAAGLVALLAAGALLRRTAPRHQRRPGRGLASGAPPGQTRAP